jgi:hypothetical protein
LISFQYYFLPIQLNVRNNDDNTTTLDCKISGTDESTVCDHKEENQNDESVQAKLVANIVITPKEASISSTTSVDGIEG